LSKTVDISFQNMGCEPAVYISALNSEDPGVVTISERTFTLPSEALQVMDLTIRGSMQ
jgi:hypothetical protein